MHEAHDGVYRCEPLRTRLWKAIEVVVLTAVAGFLLLVGVLAAFADRDSPPPLLSAQSVLILGATVAAIVWGVRRAWRLSLQASPEGVVVQNLWRRCELSWLDVVYVGINLEPTIAFRLRNQKAVYAQATPNRDDEWLAVMRELEALAPGSVEFLNLHEMEEQDRLPSTRR